MAEYDGRTYFHKAALRHLRDAKKLLEPAVSTATRGGSSTQHLQGAMYLAGYTIECVLKEFIIAHQPRANTLSDVLTERTNNGLATPDIAGAAGHNLAILWDMTSLSREIENDSARKQDLGICFRWKVTMRYGPATENRRFAEDFVFAVDRMYRWISQRV